MLGSPGQNAAVARALLRDVGSAALATVLPEGGPFASYVMTAPAGDGSPLLLLSDLAVHSANLARDPRASMLFVREPTPGSNVAAALRLTLTGTVSKHDNAASRRLFLSRHPDAVLYADFGDFFFYRFAVESGHLVAGFGRIVDLPPADLLSPELGEE